MQPSTSSTVADALSAPAVPVLPPQTASQQHVPHEPGGLLADLERRQDEVLEQLDELDAKLIEVLKGLGATLDDEEAA